MYFLHYAASRVRVTYEVWWARRKSLLAWNPSGILNGMQNYISDPNIQKVKCYCVPCKGVCVECAFSLFYSDVLKESMVALKNFRAWLLVVTWGFWLAFGSICHSWRALRFCFSVWLFICLYHPKHLIAQLEVSQNVMLCTMKWLLQ